jgi:hypothetical protein
VLADESEREVIHRAERGGGRHAAVRNDQAPGLHAHLGVALREQVRVEPGGRGLAAVEQARFGEQEGAHADRGDRGACPGLRPDRIHLGPQPGERDIEAGIAGELEARHDQHVHRSQCPDLDGESAGRHHPAPW